MSWHSPFFSSSHHFIRAIHGEQLLPNQGIPHQVCFAFQIWGFCLIFSSHLSCITPSKNIPTFLQYLQYQALPSRFAFEICGFRHRRLISLFLPVLHYNSIGRATLDSHARLSPINTPRYVGANICKCADRAMIFDYMQPVGGVRGQCNTITLPLHGRTHPSGPLH